MSTREIVICKPVRTAIGAFNGSLKGVPATDLGASVVRETLRRSGLEAGAIGSVVMGNVIQAGNKVNPARQASIGGGLPVSVPAMTVNRVCGSGAQAIVTAAQHIGAGEVDAAIAGGMENMDRAPYLMDGGRWGYRMGPAEIHDSMLRDGLDDAFSGKHSGWHTENVVTQAQLTREVQDRFAARSQQRFSTVQKAGKFAEEIVGVEIRGKKGVEAFAVDEAPRPETTFEVLAKLRPAFREGGTITAGNAPGLNSAAAAMIVADRAFAEARSVEPMARLVAYGIAAVEPGMFGLGPIPAVRKALDRAGWKLSDLERGAALGQKGNIDGAIADYSKAIDLNPNYAAAYDSRGRAYVSKGDYTRAVTDVTKAGELAPRARPQAKTNTPTPAKPKVSSWASPTVKDKKTEPFNPFQDNANGP